MMLVHHLRRPIDDPIQAFGYPPVFQIVASQQLATEETKQRQHVALFQAGPKATSFSCRP
jgi:hypothetical protein